MIIDSALAQLNNRPLRVPGSPNASASGPVHLGSPKAIDRKSPLYDQCLEFESIFTKMMLKEMRKTVDRSDDILSGGFAEEIYTDMLDDEYSKSMSKAARFGLADLLYRQLA